MSLINIQIWDTKNQKDIRILNTTGDVLYLDKLPSTGYSFRANTTTDIKSVKFIVDNVQSTARREKQEPYVWLGDFVPVMLAEGQHKLEVIPSTTTDPSGSQKTYTYTFEIKKTSPVTVKCLFKGTHGGSSIPENIIVPILKDLWMNGGIRPPYNISWSKPLTSDFFKDPRTLHNAGVPILGLFFDETMPSYQQAFDWFSQARMAAQGCITWWEIMNEPNLSQYLTSKDLAGCIKNILKAAWDALHPHGEKVVGPALASLGPQTDTNNFKIMKDNGLLEYCDYAAFHPYGPDSKSHIERVANFKNLIGNKPLFITEFNIHGNSNDLNGWAKQLQPCLDGIRQYIDGYWYFKTNVGTSMAGPAGFLNSNNTPHDPFYTTVKNLK